MPDVFVSENKETPKTQPAKHASRQIHAMPVGLFSTFCENPLGVRFESQRDNERILLFLRRHIVANIPWILVTILLLIAPLILNILFSFTTIVVFDLPPPFITIFVLFYYLIVFGYAFVNFITWFYNILIVTQIEIVDIDFSHLVYHDVAATNVNLVEDVNYTQTGFIRSFFNYGDVYVQTAGGKENIEALGIPKPAKVARIILDLIGKGGNM